MAFPGKKPVFKPKEGLCHLSADTLNKIINMLDSLQVIMTDGQTHAEVVTPNGDGSNWQIKIPSGINIPTPPDSGDYMLTSQNGVLSWVALGQFQCEEQ